MEATRVFDLLDLYRQRDKMTHALAGKQNGEWIVYSSKEYLSIAEDFALGLLALGVQPSDRVVTVTNNRPEWNFTSMAVAQIGAVHVPVNVSQSLDEFLYIFRHAMPRVLFVADAATYRRLKPLAEQASIELIYTYTKIEGMPYWEELTQKGRSQREQLLPELNRLKAAVQPDQLYAIIYTSGTTGVPKGVMLSHRNILSNVYATLPKHTHAYGHRVISFLPLSHVFEHMLNLHFQVKGLSIYYAESLTTLIDDMKAVHPHMFATVPRVLEKVYTVAITKGKTLKGVKRMLFFYCINQALSFQMKRFRLDPLYRLNILLCRKLVLSKIMASFGNAFDFVVSGGAPLQPRLARLFWASGIPLAEGYGLTETAPVIAVTDVVRGKVKPGTVGPVLENVTVKIADDGEILCKGPNVMLGYYKDPEQTAEVIDEQGWFHTGDIGLIDDEGFLRITDRKKEIFKLSNGKYVAPQAIENRLKESMFIDQAMVVGSNEKFAGAIVSPSFPYLQKWAAEQHLSFGSLRELVSDRRVIARVQKEVDHVNRSLSSTERIGRIRLVADEWTPQSGELSLTLKLKRRVITEKYEALIADLYNGSSAD
ncbi:MAG: long-chain fatty acid--CoA ligase [Bacteroidales bacterium]